MAALAAEAADDAPRALITAAPRLATVGMNVSLIQASSFTSDLAGLPSTSQCERSGYCVVEWFPQTVIFLILDTGRLTRMASCDIARLWSSRVIAVN